MRNAYVVEPITDALLKLPREKSVADISFCELCEIASIGRAPFYRNFESKEDILRGYIKEIFKGEIEQAEKKEGRPINELHEM